MKNSSVSLKGFNDENLAISVGDSLLSCFNKLNKLIDIKSIRINQKGYSDDDYISLLSEFRKWIKQNPLLLTAVGAD